MCFTRRRKENGWASEGRGEGKAYLADELDLAVDVLDDGFLLQDGLFHDLGPLDNLCAEDARRARDAGRAEVISMVSTREISTKRENSCDS